MWEEQINNIWNIDTTGGNNNISQLMEKVLDLYIDEFFSRSYTGETLTFDEWKKWLIDEIVGINEILEYYTLMLIILLIRIKSFAINFFIV